MVVKSPPRPDETGKRLFFQVLHRGRQLTGDDPTTRWAYLSGMIFAMKKNHEDIRIADKMRDFWKH
jgi:hypothetical protein